ncbi:GpE family phage tail protein [Aeromonas veronii]|uniref:GpE family phage tail protein n=1 Tax=Aeromonas veronii TaxID=654 RepID=UPI003D253C7A
MTVDLPRDVMEVEADIMLVFTGWDCNRSRDMSIAELMGWHRIAIERHQRSIEQQNGGS